MKFKLRYYNDQGSAHVTSMIEFPDSWNKLTTSGPYQVVEELAKKRRLPGLEPGHQPFNVVMTDMKTDGFDFSALILVTEPKVVAIDRVSLDELKRQAEHYPRVAGLNIKLQNLLQRWLENFSRGYDQNAPIMRETREALGDVDLKDTVASVESCNCQGGICVRTLEHHSKPSGKWVPPGEWVPQCPRCRTKMELKTNSYKLTEFWGCPRYPQCEGTRDYPRYWENRGESIEPSPNFFRESVEECHLLISRNIADFQIKKDWDSTTLPARVARIIKQLLDSRALLEDFKYALDRKTEQLQTEQQIVRDLREELEKRDDTKNLRHQVDWYKEELHRTKLKLARAAQAQENFRQDNDRQFGRVLEAHDVLRDLYDSRVIRSLMGLELLKRVKDVLGVPR